MWGDDASACQQIEPACNIPGPAWPETSPIVQQWPKLSEWQSASGPIGKDAFVLSAPDWLRCDFLLEFLSWFPHNTTVAWNFKSGKPFLSWVTFYWDICHRNNELRAAMLSPEWIKWDSDGVVVGWSTPILENILTVLKNLKMWF